MYVLFYYVVAFGLREFTTVFKIVFKQHENIRKYWKNSPFPLMSLILHTQIGRCNDKLSGISFYAARLLSTRESRRCDIRL